MTKAALEQSTSLNGFDLPAMSAVVEQVQRDPSLAQASFRVTSEWKGAAQVESKVSSYELGGQTIARQHVIRSDEPRELFGQDTAPNPQELLLSALNACMIFSYAAKAAAQGIALRKVTIEAHGSLDIRGALELADVPPGCEIIRYTVRIQADASPTQLEALHQAVMATSPNRYHLSHPIRLAPKLVIE